MKIFITTLMLMICCAGSSLADIRYVSDTLIVTVRTLPAKTSKILATVQTGAPLEILESVKGFHKIRTSKGVEGYIRSQYVTKEIPKLQRIQQLEVEKVQLQQEVTDLAAKLNTTKNKAQNLNSTTQELTRIKQEYQALRTTSADVLQISRERDLLQQENSDLTGRMQQLKEENNIYLRTGVIKWFFAGAGVLFLGWILGKISRKKKRNFT
ncbi:MAG: TIGR04211 family SH3 domain-containing protein [Geopsychrobacter sp.]|nr:TIGR04211 family SH3 domain-containing protein [Geopsychrobacter sp.]